MLTAALVQTAVTIAVMGVVLFAAAGQVAWAQGWIFLAEIAACSGALTLWLARHDPALLRTRLSGPMQRAQKIWDRFFIVAAMAVFIAWLALCGVDARRFGWSHVPVWAQVAGAVLIALSIEAARQTFRVNTYAAPQVRLQPERAHHVITGGPYSIVRHPMYAGALLMFIGTPLLLGSWWGLLAAPVGAVGFGARAVGEERMLRRNLAGYEEYAQLVRFRLIPGVW